jgi:PPOX class probable F420-dependent enzyme
MSFDISVMGTPGSGSDFAIATRTPAATLADLAPADRELIDGPYTVTLATLSRDGRMQLSPMWFRAAPDGRHVEINTVRGRAKYHHIRRHPEVSVQIIDPANPYRWLTIYGRCAEQIDEDDAARGHLVTESIDALAQLYLGQSPYPFRAGNEVRTLFLVAPTQIVTFGAG